MIQQIDGMWTLARNADRLVPSAVRTLISRRAARLPDETRTPLAEAAVLGRHFSLKDLREIELRVRRGRRRSRGARGLARASGRGRPAGPARRGFAGRLQLPPRAGPGVRDEHGSSPPRRRAIHAAIVGLLIAGRASPASLPCSPITRRLPATGRSACGSPSRPAANALAANAPEEVLRVVELALPLAATPQQRVDLLEARDRALEMLRRPDDRMQGLAELAALAEAMSATRDLELDVRLRRAAALRMNEEEDRAAQTRTRGPGARGVARRSRRASSQRASSSARTSCEAPRVRASSPPHARSTWMAPKRRTRERSRSRANSTRRRTRRSCCESSA